MIHKTLKKLQDYLNSPEIQQAPSGEFNEYSEYNLHYLTTEAEVKGMETIVSLVGSCKECQLRDTHECPISGDILDDSDYCSWFNQKDKNA